MTVLLFEVKILSKEAQDHESTRRNQSVAFNAKVAQLKLFEVNCHTLNSPRNTMCIPPRLRLGMPIWLKRQTLPLMARNWISLILVCNGDREVMSWVATTKGIDANLFGGLMIQAVEYRFSVSQTAPTLNSGFLIMGLATFPAVLAPLLELWV